MKPHDLRAILLMLLAMAAFAAGDFAIKVISGRLASAFIIALIAIAGLLVFAVIARITKTPLYHKAMLSPTGLLRHVSEGIAVCSVVTAIGILPLSTVATLFQTVPLFVTLGAVFMLGETVGPRRWIALGIGFCGMLLMLRPETSGSFSGALIAVIGSMAFAMRDLTTRLLPKDLPLILLGFWGFLAYLPAGVLLMIITDAPIVSPNIVEWSWLIFILIMTAIGYICVSASMRSAPAALVAPFRYSRLIFAAGLGIVILGERPDLITYIGAGLIVGAGLFTVWRKRAQKKQPT